MSKKGGWGRYLPAFLAAVTMLATACGAQTGGAGNGEGAQDGGELIFALPFDESSDIAFLVPPAGSCQSGCENIIQALYDTLVFQDPETNEIVPGLAESWEVSDDGLTWTVVLKDGPTFHDGTPVTAEDVKFTLDLAVDPDIPADYNSYPGSLRGNVESVEVVDDMTVQINMSEPQANFVTSVLGWGQFGIVPKHAFEEMGYEDFGRSPIGTGPYRFVEWVPNDHITLERNPDYTWGPSFTETAGGPPSLARLTFKYILESSTRLAAFEAGEINAFDGIPPNDQARLVADPEVTVVEVAKNGSPPMLVMNNAQGVTTDPDVRRAVALAIDREAYNEAVYAGVASPICTFLETRMKFLNRDACVETGDPDAAGSLLEEAGWTMGSDGIRERDGQRLELVGLVAVEQVASMEFIQAELAEVGIDLVVSPGAVAAVNEAVTSSEGWNLFLGISFTQEDPNVLRAQYHSSLIPPDGINRAWYENSEVDQLLDDGLAEVDEEAREQIYFEVQELLAADIPAVPLVSEPVNIATRSNVSGIIPDARGRYRYFHDVRIEQ